MAGGLRRGLAFVARDASGGVVGTVRLWDVRLGEGGPAALLLGPLAVDPSLKNAGIGSALMRHAIAEAARLGHGAILLVGDAPYYGRFGFSAERTGSLAMPGTLRASPLSGAGTGGRRARWRAWHTQGTGRKLKAQAPRLWRPEGRNSRRQGILGLPPKSASSPK